MKNPDEGPNITSTEIKLAQVLSANDRDTRISGLRKLTGWLTSRGETLTDAELAHVWVGLHYCLWMQDKPILQEELIEAFGGLLGLLGEYSDVAMRFFDAFLEIECRQWLSIDNHRLDKYLLLTRTMLQSIWTYLAKKEWEASAVDAFLTTYRRYITQACSSEAHDGLKFHVADVFIEELTKIEAEHQIPQAVTHQLLDPYCQLLATHENDLMIKKVKKRVFSELADQMRAHALALLEREAEADEEMDTDAASDDDNELPVHLNIDLEKLAERLLELRRLSKLETNTSDDTSGKKRRKREADAPIIRNKKVLKSVASDLKRAANFDGEEFNEEDIAEWQELEMARGGSKKRKKQREGDDDARDKRRRLRPLAEAADEEYNVIDDRELNRAAKAHVMLLQPCPKDEEAVDSESDGDGSEEVSSKPKPRLNRSKRKQKKKKLKKRKKQAVAL